jgi:hypothetical protein
MGTCASKQNVNYTGVRSVEWVSNSRPKNHIVYPISIDICSTGHACAQLITIGRTRYLKAGCPEVEGGQIKRVKRRGTGVPEQDVCSTRPWNTSRGSSVGPNHNVIVSIVVEVASGAHGPSETVAGSRANDAEALATGWGEDCQVYVREGGGGAVPEDHVGGSSVGSAAARPIMLECAHENITVAIAIHVERSTNAVTSLVARHSTAQLEASAARGEIGQVNSAERSGAVMPKNHVCRSCIRLCQRVSTICAYHDVVGSVAVHVPCGADRVATTIIRTGPRYPEARAARGEGGQVNVHPAAGLAEDHYGGTSVDASWRVIRGRTQYDVVDAVIVDVSRSTYSGAKPDISSVAEHLYGVFW